MTTNLLTSLDVLNSNKLPSLFITHQPSNSKITRSNILNKLVSITVVHYRQIHHTLQNFTSVSHESQIVLYMHSTPAKHLINFLMNYSKFKDFMMMSWLFFAREVGRLIFHLKIPDFHLLLIDSLLLIWGIEGWNLCARDGLLDFAIRCTPYSSHHHHLRLLWM